jgi:hypothetical protein
MIIKTPILTFLWQVKQWPGTVGFACIPQRWEKPS